MEKHLPLPMTQLDMLVTTKELQMMKLMLSYLPPSSRGMLAVYIKFTEFQNTLRLFGGIRCASAGEMIKSKDIHSPSDIMEDLKPFMNPKDSESFDMALNAMQMMKGMNMSDFPGANGSEEMADMMNLFDSILKGSERNE